MAVFEIEVSGPVASSLMFQPLQERVRGRWELRGALAKIEGGALFAQWSETIPGQVIGLDAEAGTGWVRDPLVTEPEHREAREKVKEAGYRLPPARQEKAGVDAVTWAFWMQRAVEAGLARVVTGQPPPLKGKPRMLFVLTEPEDKRDKVMNRLVALLLGTLPADKRGRVEEILDGLEG